MGTASKFNKPFPRRPYWFASFQFVVLAGLFFSVLYVVDDNVNTSSDYDLRRFERTVSYSNTPPIEKSDWQLTLLPERLSETFVKTYFSADKKWTSLWYRTEFNGIDLTHYQNSDEPIWSVYIVEPYANVAIYLNDSFIGESGPMKPPIPSFRRPVMFSFPKELIKPNHNVLYYRVAVSSRTPWPNHVSLGPKTVFEKKYANRMLLKKTIPFAILVMMGVLTVFMLMIFYLRPQEKVYGWYALSTSVWMLHHGMKLIDLIPVESKPLWHAFSYWTLGMFVAFGTHFIAHFSNLVALKTNRIVFWWAIIGGAILTVLANYSAKYLHSFGQFLWVPSVLCIGLYAVAILVLAFKRKPNTENKHLLLAISLLTLVGIRDYLFDFTNLVPGSTFYIQFAAGFVIIYWALILIRRFASALDMAEILNRELETRVAEKSEELEIFYANRAKANREKAVMDERQRIMRDMHDGLGGQLVQLVALSEQNPALAPVKHNLELLLSDLRLIIDSLTIEDGDLATVLGAFRYRTEPLLKKVGLKFNWQIGDLPEVESLGPTAVLQALRILQETITNVTKHASATEIKVKASKGLMANGEPSIALAISDNGKGMPNSQDGEFDNEKYGHGLRNMHYRAKSIGAEFRIVNSKQGFTVLMDLPVSA